MRFSDVAKACRNLAVRLVSCRCMEKTLNLRWHSVITVDKPLRNISIYALVTVNSRDLLREKSVFSTELHVNLCTFALFPAQSRGSSCDWRWCPHLKCAVWGISGLRLTYHRGDYAKQYFRYWNTFWLVPCRAASGIESRQRLWLEFVPVCNLRQLS